MKSKLKVRDIIIYTAAVIAFITGIGLCIAGFIVPPTGIISGSVLTALGEFLTFFGSIFGIGEYTKIQLRKLNSKGSENEDEE
jgi:hypothetical protein